MIFLEQGTETLGIVNYPDIDFTFKMKMLTLVSRYHIQGEMKERVLVKIYNSTQITDQTIQTLSQNPELVKQIVIILSIIYRNMVKKDK